MNSLTVRPEAEADLRDAYLWYEARSVELADEYLNAVDSSFRAVAENPRRFPVIHTEPDATVRRALLKRFPYAVYFIADESQNTVTVIACMHAKQEPRRWLRRVR